MSAIIHSDMAGSWQNLFSLSRRVRGDVYKINKDAEKS